MNQKKLTVIVNDKNYDLQIDVKDPTLVRAYSENLGELTDHFCANIESAMGDLHLPEDARRAICNLNVDYLEKKIEIIKNMANGGNPGRRY